MKSCAIHDAGTIELLFYEELDASERASVAGHLSHCSQCRAALEDLTVIRDALALRPDVSAPATGEWSGFMHRLDRALGIETPAAAVVPFARPRAAVQRPLLNAVAMAALLAIVAASVFLASQARQRLVKSQPAQDAVASQSAPTDVEPIQAGVASVSARHLERSKLVVLGIATREPKTAEGTDWSYERELASSLLNDTRLYRMAAEQRGLTSLASVMRDLELVLLQTSMAEASDDAALPRIQRLIRRRGLVEKMDVVGTTGSLP